MQISRITNLISPVYNNTHVILRNNIPLNTINKQDSFLRTNNMPTTSNITFNGMPGYEKLLLLEIYCGDVDGVKELLKNEHLDVNARDTEGQSFLHFAAFNGNTEILKSLLERNDININAQNNDGYTALHYAVNQGKSDAVSVLLKHRDINVNVKNKKGNSALFYAASFGEIEATKLLLSHKNIDVNIQGAKNNTPLHMAVLNGKPEIVKLLFQHKDLDVNATNQSGETALDLLKSRQAYLNNTEEEKKQNKELLRLFSEKIDQAKEQNNDDINSVSSIKRKNRNRQARFTIRKY